MYICIRPVWDLCGHIHLKHRLKHKHIYYDKLQDIFLLDGYLDLK